MLDNGCHSDGDVFRLGGKNESRGGGKRQNKCAHRGIPPIVLLFPPSLRKG